MSQQIPPSILIVNEHAEETKLATIGLRGFFPDSRIDVAFSAEDARTLSSSQNQQWALILVDEDCLSGANQTLIDDLKRNSLHASVLLLSGRSDSRSAIQALQTGADYFLAKQSDAFLTELLFCAREALDMRALRVAAERSDARYRQLLDTLGDVLYELDQEGRFLTVSPVIESFLGYSHDELIGQPYTRLFPPEQLGEAAFRFNERRSGARSARDHSLAFRRKPGSGGAPPVVTGAVTARGLYDSHRSFLGTIGLIRDIGSASRQAELSGPAQRESSQAKELLHLAHRIGGLAQTMQAPLSDVLTEARQLLETLRELRLEDRLHQFIDRASGAADTGRQLTREIESLAEPGAQETINDLIQNAAASLTGEQGEIADVDMALAAQLPGYAGDRNNAVEFFRMLITYGKHLLTVVGRPHRLMIRTRPVGPSESEDRPALFPMAPPAEVEVEVSESEAPVHGSIPAHTAHRQTDFVELYRLVRLLNGVLDFSVPASGPFRVIARLPTHASRAAEPPQPHHRTLEPRPQIIPDISDRPPPPIVESGKAARVDRRAHPRVPATLPAQITVDSTTWNGTVSDLSLGGVCIAVTTGFPALGEQDAFVVLETAAGVLELNGTAHSRQIQVGATRPDSSVTRLIIEFGVPPPTEAAVLTSMLDAVREQAMTLSINVLLSSPQKDSSVESPPSRGEPGHDDRRESIRAPLLLPVRLECIQADGQGPRLLAKTVNISRDGACLFVKSSRTQLSGQVVLHFAPALSSSHPGPHEPGTPGSALTAVVLWAAEDPTAPGEFRLDGTTSALRIGIRFVSLTPFAERELVRLVRQHMISSRPSTLPEDKPSVVSVRRECRNPRGQAIAMMDDHLRQPAAAGMPILILAPGFGQTASDYAAFAHYAAHHRFRVLRYDHTNHVGMSDGELHNTTLRGMQSDLAKVVEFVQHTWPSAPIVVVATDLSARAALKLAAHSRPFDLLVLVNPVLDVGAQLMSTHGHDLVSDYQYGLRRGIANLFGLNVNVDQFVGDLITGRLADLASSLEDIRLVRTPLCLVASPVLESNPLAPSDLPHAVMTAVDPQTRIASVSTSLAVQDSSSAQPHFASFRQILEQAASRLSIPAPDADLLGSLLESVEQRRLEREHLRLHHNVSQISREALAIAFSQQLPNLANVHVYRKLLDDLYAFLSPLQEGKCVLDTGLGQSEVSRALVVNHTYRTRQRGLSLTHPPLLVGLRRTSDVIQRARQDVLALQRELVSGTSGGIATVPSLASGWVQGDWSTPLPIQAHSIHRLVSNMALPFVVSPRETLMEWYRTLQPGGRAVFTVFHPLTDLSQLYRRHLRLANQDEFGMQAQQVLHYMARLREAICHGIVHVFDRASLTSLLRQLHQASFRISPTLNGQALAVVVEKAQIL